MEITNNSVIKICMGSSCFARGNNENLTLIEDFITKNKLTTKIELIGSRCEDKCAKGPYIKINDTALENIYEGDLTKLLEKQYLIGLEGKK